ncbi:14202_t:CDS:1, partial [Entrophospora sp. SA101]
PALMIKKLRYYARFIVVCLLLNNREIVQKLMDELSGLVDDYIKNFKPVDSLEWQLVLQEIGTFLE